MASIDPNDKSEDWMFDVSALMVLISENEELKYRLSGRNLLQAICAAPVSGIQTYLKSYDVLLEPSSYAYFSPYGGKSAPLRNLALENAIKRGRLLEDGKCTFFRIPQSRRRTGNEPLKLIWAGFTWACMGGLIVMSLMAPKATWIGPTNSLVYTGWSIILRIVEFVMIKPSREPDSTCRPDAPDAVYILGRDNSALVLSGSRRDIKAWTTRGFVYNQDAKSPHTTSFWQMFTKVGTLLVIFLSFSTIPNGSTMDQVVFILLNLLGQANTLLGLWLNGRSCLDSLEELPGGKHVKNRTATYASLILFFKDVQDRNWTEKAGLLPQTPVWTEWRDRIVREPDADPKALYNEINEAHQRASNKKISIDSAITTVDPKSQNEEKATVCHQESVASISR
ncbi:hypothetical protein PG993_015196 [Apiospora rasikravindrae]|uniref:Uncharacterized protein n=1 Tax=Apiospora rasikravindrae TaxID=990691 RepID=A0ABR1RQ74_9PEZI